MRWLLAFLRSPDAAPMPVGVPPPKPMSAPAAVTTHARGAPDPSTNGSGVDIHFIDMAIEGGAVIAAPAAVILQRIEPLVQRLYHEIGWGKEDFDALIRPLVVRYAEYVHLLPASESHHHSRLGGLLVHGLEVAIEATRASREAVVDLDRVFLRDIELRASRNRLWPVAAACAGFLHDLGKALVDLMVARTDTDEVWNPYECSLSDWITQNNVTSYTVGWRAGQRHKRHEPFGLVITWPVIGKDLIALLNAYGRDMFEEMLLGAQEDTQVSNGLGKIVAAADVASVRRDRDAQRRRWREGMVGGHPVINRILEAFQGLLADGQWQPNTIGGCAWVTRHGIFLNWAHAVSQARGWLRENAATGTIPNDANAIADLLIDAQIAKPRLMADGSVSQIWMVKPMTPAGFTGLGPTMGVVQMLLIPDANMLFKGRVMPDPVELEIMRDTTGVEVVEVVESEPDEVANPEAPPAEESPASISSLRPATPPSPAVVTVTPTPVPTPIPEPVPPPLAMTPPNSPTLPAPAPVQSDAAAIPSNAEAMAYFESCGVLGRWLIPLMTDCAKDPERFSSIVCYREKKLVLRWPDAVTAYSLEPVDIVHYLNEHPDLLAQSYRGAVIDPARGSLVIKALINPSEPLWPALIFSEQVSLMAFIIGDTRPALEKKLRIEFSEWAQAQSARKDLSVIPAGQLISAHARAASLKPKSVLNALLREPSLITGMGGHEADQRLDMGVVSALLDEARK